MEPLPEGLSLHSFRRSFASVCVALGEDPSTVMNQMGHTDSAFTLSVYSQAMRRKDGDRERLRRLVNGEAIGHTPGPGDPIERVQTGTDDASTGTGSRKGQTA